MRARPDETDEMDEADEMNERTCRGYMIHGAVSYIEGTYDPPTRKTIYDRIRPGVRDLVASVDTVRWYPVEDAAEIFTAIAAHHRETDGELLLALERVGRAIAETVRDTSLKLFFRLLTPALFAAKASDLWERNDRCGALTVLSYEPESRRMRIALTGVKGYDYIGFVASGFMLLSLEALGCKDTRVTFDSSGQDPAPEEFIYDFQWQ